MRIFLIDVAWRYLSAADKIGFCKWGIVDLISAIPFITVLRYGRIISAARIMLSARQRGKWTAIPRGRWRSGVQKARGIG